MRSARGLTFIASGWSNEIIACSFVYAEKTQSHPCAAGGKLLRPARLRAMEHPDVAVAPGLECGFPRSTAPAGRVRHDLCRSAHRERLELEQTLFLRAIHCRSEH